MVSSKESPTFSPDIKKKALQLQQRRSTPDEAGRVYLWPAETQSEVGNYLLFLRGEGSARYRNILDLVKDEPDAEATREYFGVQESLYRCIKEGIPVSEVEGDLSLRYTIQARIDELLGGERKEKLEPISLQEVEPYLLLDLRDPRVFHQLVKHYQEFLITYERYLDQPAPLFSFKELVKRLKMNSHYFNRNRQIGLDGIDEEGNPVVGNSMDGFRTLLDIDSFLAAETEIEKLPIDTRSKTVLKGVIRYYAERVRVNKEDGLKKIEYYRQEMETVPAKVEHLLLPSLDIILERLTQNPTYRNEILHKLMEGDIKYAVGEAKAAKNFQAPILQYTVFYKIVGIDSDGGIRLQEANPDGYKYKEAIPAPNDPAYQRAVCESSRMEEAARLQEIEFKKMQKLEQIKADKMYRKWRRGPHGGL